MAKISFANKTIITHIYWMNMQYGSQLGHTLLTKVIGSKTVPLGLDLSMVLDWTVNAYTLYAKI